MLQLTHSWFLNDVTVVHPEAVPVQSYTSEAARYSASRSSACTALSSAHRHGSLSHALSQRCAAIAGNQLGWNLSGASESHAWQAMLLFVVIVPFRPALSFQLL